MKISRTAAQKLGLALVLILAISSCRADAGGTPVATSPEMRIPTLTPQLAVVEATQTNETGGQQTATPGSEGPAAPQPTTPAVGAATTYVVKEGDTLGAIALEFDLTVEELVKANDLESADFIRVGQTLTIPTGLVALATLAPTPTATESAPADAATPVAENTPDPGAIPTLPPVEAGLITNGDRAKPYVALTFDACQTASNPAGYDAALINALIEKRAPATLFLGGLWMQSHPTQTQMLATNELFELGNHSWSHLDFAEIDVATMEDEILLTQEIMHDLVGRQPTLFRLPFGTYTDEALDVIAQHGLLTIQWDVVTGDPDPNISAASIVQTVTREAQNGSIVIMHMNTRGWHTAEALPDLIDGLRQQGFRLVTVSQILGLEPVPAP